MPSAVVAGDQFPGDEKRDPLTAAFSEGEKSTRPKLTSTGKVLLGVTGASFALVCAVTTPFILPALRKVCLPYVPATTEQVNNVLRLLRGKTGRLIDLGSGDGRIVIEAARLGLPKAEGVELNPWLVLYSRWKSLWAGTRRQTRFFTQDLWKTDLGVYQHVVVFGVDSMMPKLEEKFVRELEADTQIIVCRFPLPNLTPVKTYAQVSRECGVDVSADRLHSFYKPVWDEHRREIPDYGKVQGMTSGQWWDMFLGRLFSSAGYHVDATTRLQISRRLWERFEAGDNWEVLPNTTQVLETLKSREFKLGVVSNFDERLDTTLQRHNLQHYFDFLVSSATFKISKPDPRIFLRAAELGGVSADQTVHVGDSVFKDYFGAKEAGLKALLLDQDFRNHLSAKEIGIPEPEILKDIRELPDKLELTTNK